MAQTKSFTPLLMQRYQNYKRDNQAVINACGEIFKKIPYPNVVLEIGCGIGDLAKYTASFYPKSQVYGLDNNEKALDLGIKKGNFDRAQAILGDAYDLGKKNPDFKLVGTNEHSQIRIPKADLTIACNPVYEISMHELKALIEGSPSRGQMPLSVMRPSIADGGYILRFDAIASRGSSIRGGVELNNVSDAYVESCMKGKREEAAKNSMKTVKIEGYKDYRIIDSRSEKDLAVLFKDKR
ncbi:MAG: class I SAM-dependent methyltransferase [Candidatus Aenigmatarchaeota archaeon]